MSIYGALYTGVTGLGAQGESIAIISDNIANINTVGYKAGAATFETLVTNASSVTRYSPGGVLSANRPLIDSQGILQSTNSPTDLALSGSGFFIVSTDAASQATDAEFLYTRAGSFRQDNLGNMVNAAGFYLQGWPLDRDGLLPGETGNLNTTSSANLDSLETVNLESSSGIATATTSVEVGANLDAGEDIHEGAGISIDMFTGSLNETVAAEDIIVHDNGGLASAIAIGDEMFIEDSSGLTFTYRYGGFAFSDDITANAILGASTTTQVFTTPNNGDTMTIQTATAGTVEFTFSQSSPNIFTGEFNNLTTLANAINEVNGLTARIANNRIYIGSTDPSEVVTLNGDPNGTNAVDMFTNGADGVFDNGGNTAELAGNANTFNSLQSLADLVNNDDGITAVIENSLDDTTLEIRTDDPLGTINFYDGNDNDTTAAPTNTGSLLNEFGLATDADYAAGANGVENEITNKGPSYDSTASATNMASGNVVADFSRNIRVFDALGAGHDLRMSFLKVDTNEWAIEIHAVPEDDINSSLVDGQVATGTIVFNGDGSLRSVSSNLRQPIEISWTNGSQASEIEFDWGTAGQPFGTLNATDIGLTDGLSQFEADYNVAFVTQNGAEVGSLIGVDIDADGFVIASFSNGESQRLYKLPVADFANFNALEARSGNVYGQTDASGEINLREAGTNGIGTFVAGALESSTVDLAEELTDLIVAQRAYQANTKVISTSDELLDELNRL